MMHKSLLSVVAFAALAAASPQAASGSAQAVSSSQASASSAAGSAQTTGTAASANASGSSSPSGTRSATRTVTITSGGVIPTDLVDLPGPCRTALSPLLNGNCPSINIGSFLDINIDSIAGANAALMSAVTQVASCVCYTSGTFAASYVDNQLSSCVAQWNTAPLATMTGDDTIPTELAQLCSFVGDVRASMTGSSSGSGSAAPTGSSTPTETKTNSSVSATPSGKSSANAMKIDWIVMGSASLVAVVGAVAAML